MEKAWSLESKWFWSFDIQSIQNQDGMAATASHQQPAGTHSIGLIVMNLDKMNATIIVPNVKNTTNV